MYRPPAIFSGMPLLLLSIFLAVVTTVICQQTPWRPNSGSDQFAPLQLLQQNWPGMSPVAMQSNSNMLTRPNALSTGKRFGGFGGKLRLLSTLMGGLRNSGLEASIAGEVLQRLIKTVLRDVLVPYKQNVFGGFQSL